MKRFIYLLFIPGLVATLFGCETVIDAKLDSGPTQLSVDATIYNTAGPQTVRLTQTAPYLENKPTPAATGATVRVTDSDGRVFAFVDPDNDGNYVWTPASSRDTLGRIGQTYTLAITYQSDSYRATSRMNRVPPVDSIVFRKQKINPLATEEGYRAEFFARDIAGAIDYYRIRYSRNGVLQNQINDILTVYNGSLFGGSSNTDGLIFIRPARQSINPPNLFAMGDEVVVLLQSITAENYFFLTVLQEQLQNSGQFAPPATNLPTNIVNTTPNGLAATGFFVASAVQGRKAVVAPATIRASE